MVSPKMAESTQPTQVVQLDRLQGISEALSATEAAYYMQIVHVVAYCVSFVEEPDVGNPQVRFCEGH